MRKILVLNLILMLLLFYRCDSSEKNSGNDLPRIAIAGLAIESSTFSPAVTHEDAFHAKRGKEIFYYYQIITDS